MARYSEGPWYRGAKDRWYVWHDGRQHNLGVKGRANRKAARDAWQTLMANGPVPRPADNRLGPTPGVVTVGQVLDGYLADLADLADRADRAKPNTVKVHAYFYGLFTGQFGDWSADRMKPHDAEAFVRRPGWSADTRNAMLTALVSAYRWSIRAGLLTVNPLQNVRKPQKRSRHHRTRVQAAL